MLLLNPDARLERAGLEALVALLDAQPRAGLAAPRILEASGELAYSQRRFPRLRSTFAQALFLHRLWPRADWTDELIRDRAAYELPASPDWVSGACMLIRRAALEQLGGLDEDFFLYCEDIDLCARLRDAGWSIQLRARGRGPPRGRGLGRRARSCTRCTRATVCCYARKHARHWTVALERMGVALGHATHALVAVARPPARRGHLHALREVLRPIGSG